MVRHDGRMVLQKGRMVGVADETDVHRVDVSG